MNYEILYTSARSGLKPGSSGYCTVKGSRGIPGPTLDLLESLSGYRHVFTPGTPEAAHNPVNWGHYLLRISGRMEHVLSRVSDCETDYTGRSNKLAHHMVVDSTACPAGPAWLLSQRGWMIDRWDGQVEQFAAVRTAPAERRPPGKCVAWERMTGDAGWAGVIAEAFLADPERKVFVIYRPDMNILPLFEEALSLLPESRRWEVTFATHGAALPSTVDCLWSGIVAGSPEVQQSRRFVNALRINLTLPVPPADGGSLVDVARTGVMKKQAPAGSRSTTPRTPAPPIDLAEIEASESPPRPPVGARALEASWEPEPPSLPTRDRGGSPVIWWLLLASVILVVSGAGGAAALLVWNRAQPHPVADGSNRPETQENGAKAVVADARSREQPLDATGQDRQGDSATGAGSLPMSATPMTPPMPPMSGKQSAGVEPPKDSAAANGELPPKETTADAKAPAESMPKPSEVAAVPMSTVGSNGEPLKPLQQTQPQIIQASDEPVLTKKPGEAIELAIRPDTKLRFRRFTRASLLIPRGRKDNDHKNFHDLAKQSFKDGVLSVGIENSVGLLQAHLHAEAKINDSGVLAVFLTPAIKLDLPFKESLAHGVLHLQELESNANALIYLSPPEQTLDPFLVNDDFVKLKIPTRLKRLLTDIEPLDLRISEVALSLGTKKLEPIQSDGKMTWDLSPHSGGLIKTIEIAPRLTVTGDHLYLHCTYSPSLKTEEANVTTLQLALDSTQDLMKMQTPSLSKEILALKPDLRRVPSEAAVDLAADNLRRAVGDLLLKEKEDKKVPDDKFKSTREAVMKSIDGYIASLKEWVRKRSALDGMQAKMELISGRVGYVVLPINSVSDAPGIAKLPDGAKDLVVDIWDIDASN